MVKKWCQGRNTYKKKTYSTSLRCHSRLESFICQFSECFISRFLIFFIFSTDSANIIFLSSLSTVQQQQILQILDDFCWISTLSRVNWIFNQYDNKFFCCLCVCDCAMRRKLNKKKNASLTLWFLACDGGGNHTKNRWKMHRNGKHSLCYQRIVIDF